MHIMVCSRALLKHRMLRLAGWMEADVWMDVWIDVRLERWTDRMTDGLLDVR